MGPLKLSKKVIKKTFVGPLKLSKRAPKTLPKTPGKPQQHPTKPRTRKNLNFRAVHYKESTEKASQSLPENAERLSEAASKHHERGLGRYRRNKTSKNMIFEGCT